MSETHNWNRRDAGAEPRGPAAGRDDSGDEDGEQGRNRALRGGRSGEIAASRSGSHVDEEEANRTGDSTRRGQEWERVRNVAGNKRS